MLIFADHKQKNHYALQKPRDNGVGLDGKKRLQAVSVKRAGGPVVSKQQFWKNSYGHKNSAIFGLLFWFLFSTSVQPWRFGPFLCLPPRCDVEEEVLYQQSLAMCAKFLQMREYDNERTVGIRHSSNGHLYSFSKFEVRPGLSKYVCVMPDQSRLLI